MVSGGVTSRGRVAGVDTRTGLTSVTFNDRVVLDEVFSYFTASTQLLPRNLTGRIILGKWHFQDTWLQSLGPVSNLNIVGRKLTAGEMLAVTQGCQPLSGEGGGGHLSWGDMEWAQAGSVQVQEVQQQELCQQRPLWFSLEAPVSWHGCKASCHKFLAARMPSLPDQERSREIAEWFMGRMFMQENTSATPAPFPRGCTRFWLPLTDLAEDGVWVDDNTGEEAAHTEWKQGEPNGGTTQNCGNIVPPGR